MTWVPSDDSDQTGHPPSLIRVFAVRMKKPWLLSYPLSGQQRLLSDWVDTHVILLVLSLFGSIISHLINNFYTRSFKWFKTTFPFHKKFVKYLKENYGFRETDKVDIWWHLNDNWASPWDYGTYHTGDQRMLRRACVIMQSRQSRRCSHT